VSATGGNAGRLGRLGVGTDGCNERHLNLAGIGLGLALALG
jgi:hypothetical protein